MESLLRHREFAKLLCYWLFVLVVLVAFVPTCFFFELYLSSRCGVCLILSRSYLLVLMAVA